MVRTLLASALLWRILVAHVWQALMQNRRHEADMSLSPTCLNIHIPTWHSEAICQCKMFSPWHALQALSVMPILGLYFVREEYAQLLSTHISMTRQQLRLCFLTSFLHDVAGDALVLAISAVKSSAACLRLVSYHRHIWVRGCNKSGSSCLDAGTEENHL